MHKQSMPITILVIIQIHVWLSDSQRKKFGGDSLLSKEELAAMVAAEEKRLGVNSPEFMERHNEIMEMADDIQSRYKKSAPISTANTDRSE